MINVVSTSINGWVNEDTLELVPKDKATLFFSRGQAERFIFQSIRMANNYENHISNIETNKEIVSNFVNESIKGNLLDALINGCEIIYMGV